MDEQQPASNLGPATSQPSPVVAPAAPAPSARTIKLKYIVIIVVIVLVAAALYFMKSMVIAATVNGTPISRISVIRESEKQAGKGALDFLIVKKLIRDEVKAKNIAVSADEIKGKRGEIETNVSAQGQTLAAFLEAQGLTDVELDEQIVLQRQVEKLVADRVAVSDADVDAYITENKMTFPAGSDVNLEKQKVKEFLMGQKQNEEIQAYIESLRQKATINYFIEY